MFNLASKSKPVLKWAGGKSTCLPQLIPLFPKAFDRLIEPFLGGGALFLSLSPNTRSLINDVNSEIMNFYEVIRDHVDSLIVELKRLEKCYSKTFYYRLRDQDSLDPTIRAARTLFLNKTGFNGLYRQNENGFFNVPFGHRKTCPSLYDLENLNAVSKRLRGAQMTNVDFEETIAQAGPGDFVYCDPPYSPLSPTASFTSYTRNSFSNKDQVRLRDVSRRAIVHGATVAISNSHSPFIKDLYRDEKVACIKSKRAINSKGDRRGEIEDVCILMSPGS